MNRHRDNKQRIEICLNGNIVVEHKQAGASRPSGRFGFKIGLPQRKKDAAMPLELSITNEQQIRVTVTPKTDTNKPASLDGMPSWSVVSGNSQLQVADDGLSALLVSSNDPGDTVFLVKADADLGEGVEEISDTINLKVLGATAKNLGLTAGQPEAKPEVPPPAPV